HISAASVDNVVPTEDTALPITSLNGFTIPLNARLSCWRQRFAVDTNEDLALIEHPFPAQFGHALQFLNQIFCMSDIIVQSF
ncbi:8684_t:CDS:1, partial [Funneliformis mosseae]